MHIFCDDSKQRVMHIIRYPWTVSTLIYASTASMAWVVQFIAGFDNTRVFSVTTNLVAIGMLVVLFGHGSSYECPATLYGLGLLYWLAAASSFAFHIHEDVFSPRHTLDIAFPWVLYLYLVCTALHALARTVHGTLVVATLLFYTCVLITFVCYDAVYEDQILRIFLPTGFVLYCTLFALRTEVHARKTTKVVALARSSWDILSLLLLHLFSAVFRSDDWVSSHHRHDYEHGQWHLLNGHIIITVGLFVLQAHYETSTECELCVQAALFAQQLGLFVLCFVDTSLLAYSVVAASLSFAVLAVSAFHTYYESHSTPPVTPSDRTTPPSVTKLERSKRIQREQR